MTTAEHKRLQEIEDDNFGWRRWGPYVSDRAWATVREDYSAEGNVWGFLPHDLALYAWLRDLPPISPTYSSRRSSCISGQRFSTA